MTDDEIRAALIAAIPSGNINWTDEEQAEMLLPAVRDLLSGPIDLSRLAARIATPAELRAR